MKLSIVLAVSMILASLADVSDAKVDYCKMQYQCTAEATFPFCAVNSHGDKKVFYHSCDVTKYNCKYNDDFKPLYDMRLHEIATGFFVCAA